MRRWVSKHFGIRIMHWLYPTRQRIVEPELVFASGGEAVAVEYASKR